MTKLTFLFPLSLVAAPALAGEPLPIATRTIATADLDLNTAAGQALLDRRIARAAVEVCGQAANVDLGGRNAVRACRTRTIAAANEARNQRIEWPRRGPTTLAAR